MPHWLDGVDINDGEALRQAQAGQLHRLGVKLDWTEEELWAEIARWRSLPPEERCRTLIATRPDAANQREATVSTEDRSS
jgi:hypothetical protein